MGITKHMAHAVTVAAFGASLLGLAGCSTAINGVTANTAATDGPVVKELLTVGFVSSGADDAWSVANEADIKSSFTKEAGFDLEYAPVSGVNQKAQIDAFGALVDDAVDVILLSTAVSTGWESSLRNAQEAEIPVVLIDRGIEPDDTSLYATRIAAGDSAAGKAVASWAVSAFPEGAKYVVLQGTDGDAAVSARNSGWDSVMADLPAFQKVGSQAANWSTDMASSAIATMLEANGNDVQLIFAQDDDMALGAALAVEAAGLTPGANVKIVSIGGSRSALQALLEGRLSFVAEYNPLLGKTATEVVATIVAGGTIDPIVVVPSRTFASITQEELDARPY